MAEKKIKSVFSKQIVYSDTKEAKDLYSKSRFGEVKEGKIIYSLVEAMFLVDIKKMNVVNEGNKKTSKDEFLKYARINEPGFDIRYAVFKDLRERGYIVKTALKFGADFRVYDRGVKPGDDHAKWVVFPVFETENFTGFDFAAKNRVAHSTKKKLLLAIVDAEMDVSYWESGWVKP